ncbi:MAG TPA: hypothetical protein VG273_25935 [Bryobacteraceae bacterium]|jgi:hypothetical protein|nr:hypothetical protein [Bryobacteraceae bacterium]
MTPVVTTAFDCVPRQTATAQPRKPAPECKRCGSKDLWRVAQRGGIIGLIMRHRRLKPVQCRACGWTCYKPGGHEARIWRPA